ncbi:hypothetical protein JNE17039_40790 [Escherichia coli]
MAISIKGVNTGVIRKSNNFIALALKIKEPRNKESLFFLSVMELRDLLIALESRLHQKLLHAFSMSKLAIKSLRKWQKISQKFWLMSLKMPILIVGLTRWNLPIIRAKILPSY